MSPTKLIKLAPTAILLAFLGYAAFTLQAELPGAAERESELTKGLDVLLEEVVSLRPTVSGELGRLRDPFIPVARPVAKAEAEAREAPSQRSDPLVDVVAGLSLDATFIQGRDQLAIIDGRIYQKGQSLVLPGDNDPDRPRLQVLFVRPTGVILRAGERNYLLGYPEELGRRPASEAGTAEDREPGLAELDPAGQAAMFQRLLNSPLGALGKSLIGDAASPRRPGGTRPRADRARPTDPARR